MAKNFPSTDHLLTQKGRLMLAFLWTLWWPDWAHAQLSVFGQAQQHAGLGLLSAQHWQNESLQAPAQRTWNYAVAQAGARYSWGDWAATAYRSCEFAFTGDHHVLTLASEYDRTQTIHTQALDNLQLKGQWYQLESSHLSLSKQWNWADTGFIAFEPHVYQIHHYEHTRLDLTLKTTGATQKTLSGTVDRVGTKVYGFDPNNQADAGTGWGLNVRAGLHNPWGTTTFSAKNALGHLQFSNVHYSNRRYAIVTNNTQLSPQDTPALMGRYGQFKKQEKLPVFWQVHQNWQSLPGFSVGYLGLNGQGSFQASYAYPLSYGHIKLTQTGLYQTQLSGQWQPTPSFSLMLGMTVFKGSHPQWSFISANLQF